MVRMAFAYAGLDWQHYVTTDSSLHRPAEVDMLCGDASKARSVFGWRASTSLKQLLGMMIEADLARQGVTR